MVDNKKSLSALIIGSLGIIYGDIGTSPLYALNEVFFGHGHFSLSVNNIVGVSSLIFWIFILIVCIKYVVFVLRADNDGEGGPFALLNVLHKHKTKKFTVISFLLLFATGLLFGEGIITPAISVLSAIEGIKVIAPAFESWVIPITVFVLALIFGIQRFGSSTIGKIYGPIMLVWFFTLAVLGIVHILQYPQIILYTLNPLSALSFLFSMNLYSIALILSSVFLVITGGEALYADMGHFGNKSIRIGWFFIVFPALILNYMGQSAYLLSGKVVHHNNLFYSLVSEDFLIPLIILATMAAFIASVALIFGMYSIVAQAIAMRIIPRVNVYHTNKDIEGQIYIPFVNWILFIGSVTLVVVFQSATNLAAAYGLSVSGVMLTTSIALFFVARSAWKWSLIQALCVFGSFIVIDTLFVASNSIKFLEGGYIPIVLGVCIFIITGTWTWGRKVIRIAHTDFAKHRNISWLLELKERTEQSKGILKDSKRRFFVQTDRAVVFLVSSFVKDVKFPVPTSIRIYMKSRGSLPKNMVILHIEQIHTPFTQEHERYEVVKFSEDVYSIRARYGFMEKPDIGKILQYIYDQELLDDKFLRCTLEVSEDDFVIEHTVSWKYRFLLGLFKFLAKNSLPRYKFFGFYSAITPGVSKTIVPIRVSKQGVSIDVPEYKFQDVENKHPLPTSKKSIRFRDVWGT